MKKSIYFILSFFCLMSMLASCFDDNTVDYSGYNECAITAFSLKDFEWSDTLPDQYGSDSTFTTSISASNYHFTIDQEKGLIYNNDSLPAGTPINKILASVTADGNASFQYDSDSTWYAMTDTINFNRKVVATVFSYNGNNSKKYTIRVNVHQQDSTSSHWDRNAGMWIGKSLVAPRAVTYGKQVAVYGLLNGNLMVTKAAQNSMDWSTPVPVVGISNEACYDNITCYQNTLYILDKETLYVSDDAVNWTQMQTNTPISHLLGCNSSELFGVYNNTFFTTSDGISWNQEATEYPEFIPDSNIFSFYSPMTTNSNLERTVVFGQQKESTDTIASSWYRDNGYQDNYSNTWGYMYTSRDNNYALPNLNNLVVLYYKKYLIAFGNDCRNKGYYRPFERLLVSKDWGLTWKSQKDEKLDTYLELPAELYRNSNDFAAYVDDDANLWILMSQTGDMWCGYIHFMKFAE